MMAEENFSVERLGVALGAEIHGIDLADSPGDACIAQIRKALLAHGVIFFRNQSLDAASLLALARRFGTPAPYPFVAGTEFPEVVEVRKEPHEEVNFGGLWHTDTSYMEKPPLGSILYAVEVPPQGGDTLFTCMYRAYESLPDALRNKLDGRFGINSSRKAAAAVTRTARIDDNPGKKKDDVFRSRHPIVRTHPETGRKALYCSDAHTVEIEGMDETESDEILKRLYAEQQREEFVYRFQWRRGSVAFWDNRCTQHNAINDYHGHRRVMLRVTIEGDVPH